MALTFLSFSHLRQWRNDDFRRARRRRRGRAHLPVGGRVGEPQWMLAYGQHEDWTPTHGYEPTREAAMAAFARSWRRE